MHVLKNTFHQQFIELQKSLSHQKVDNMSSIVPQLVINNTLIEFLPNIINSVDDLVYYMDIINEYFRSISLVLRPHITPQFFSSLYQYMKMVFSYLPRFQELSDRKNFLLIFFKQLLDSGIIISFEKLLTLVNTFANSFEFDEAFTYLKSEICHQVFSLLISNKEFNLLMQKDGSNDNSAEKIQNEFESFFTACVYTVYPDHPTFKDHCGFLKNSIEKLVILKYFFSNRKILSWMGYCDGQEAHPSAVPQLAIENEMNDVIENFPLDHLNKGFNYLMNMFYVWFEPSQYNISRSLADSFIKLINLYNCDNCTEQNYKFITKVYTMFLSKLEKHKEDMQMSDIAASLIHGLFKWLIINPQKKPDQNSVI